MPGVPLLADFTVSTTFVVLACLAIVAQSIYILVALFGPGLRYKITAPRQDSITSEEFLWNIEAITDAKLNHCNRLEVFTNGDNFYEAELQSIREAKKNINLESYIFQKG